MVAVDATAAASGPVVVLVGLPGSGKTTVGRLVAEDLGLPFVDSDLLIEQRQSAPCGEVFTELGEPRFRALEADVIAEALTQPGVLSLGGGAVVTASTRARLAHVPVVWIDVSVDEGVRRTLMDDTRPVLQAADPVARYRQLRAERLAFYEEVSTWRLSSDDRSPHDLAAEIHDRLRQAADLPTTTQK
ncbi:shikimate kinase [Corynebacterium sp. 13CS0277]|uniref:shikimate kinase n=1 Tax=Corynebacterium sp. 13CS0277 TaxID=2071994 RepID=UPI000D02841A|nr:shikimate kinase [Corynebacterium sp. 13CS0277]PRQ11957.1 shikimate kinase [Corynebacterium sp. 13CS0277]